MADKLITSELALKKMIKVVSGSSTATSGPFHGSSSSDPLAAAGFYLEKLKEKPKDYHSAIASE